MARQIELAFTTPLFIAASQLNGLRRDAIAALEAARLAPPIGDPSDASLCVTSPIPNTASPTLATC